MPSRHDPLAAFARACGRRFGQDVARCNDEGAFIVLDDAIVHVRLDPEAGRTVFWTDLDMPSHLAIDVVEHVAMDYTAERFLDAGFVMGVNRAAGLIALGRSVDAAVLGEDHAFELVESLAREAPAALVRLEKARSDARLSDSQDIDPNAITFRS